MDPIDRQLAKLTADHANVANRTETAATAAAERVKSLKAQNEKERADAARLATASAALRDARRKVEALEQSLADLLEKKSAAIEELQTAIVAAQAALEQVAS